MIQEIEKAKAELEKAVAELKTLKIDGRVTAEDVKGIDACRLAAMESMALLEKKVFEISRIANAVNEAVRS